MRQLFVQCVAVFLFSFVADIIACVHVRTLVDDKMLISAATVLALQLLGHWPQCWFIDYKGRAERWSITWSSGVGAALGTVVVIHMGW